MSNSSTLDLTAVYPYLLANSLRDDEILAALRDETAQLAESNMQIAPEQGQFMALLVNLIRAKQIIEIGTFTGYSSLCMARALPTDGRLICCDLSEQWTHTAQRYWQQAGVAEKIELRIGPAADTLQQLLDQGFANSFHMVFIDADKTGYDQYYELCLQLVASNGLILFDNMLWNGRVADASNQDEDTKALRRLNEKLHKDQRIELSLLPMADGLTLARKL